MTGLLLQLPGKCLWPVVTSFWSDLIQDLSSAPTLAFTPLSNQFITKSNPIPGHGCAYSFSSSSSHYSFFHLLLTHSLLLNFLQAWTDIRLTSPQLCRQALYKLALKNLTIQTVSPRLVNNYSSISLLAINFRICA